MPVVPLLSPMPPRPPRAASRVPIALAAASALWLSACGGGGGSDSGQGQSSVVTQSDGSVQVLAGQVEKGPLQRGSLVTINTLTSAPTTLAAGTTTALPNASAAVTLPALVPTGSSFTMEVTNDFGGFTPQSPAIFQSAFIETSAQGYYFHELSGQRSSDQLALRGLSNLKSDLAINVNLLTDLTRQRTLNLARAAAGTGSVTSTIFNTARQQAQTEALRAFNISLSDLAGVNAFGEMDIKRLTTDTTVRPADQILLALSALALQVGQDGAGLQDFLSRFEEDLTDNGVIDSADLRNRILQASAAVDFTQVATNMNRFYGVSGKFTADALWKWVDRSGGVFGLLGKDVQYPAGGTFTTGATLESRVLTVAGTAAAGCYGVEMNNAGYGSAQLISGSSAVANGQLYPVASTAASLKLRFTPTHPGAVAYLVRWQPLSGACSLTSQTGKTRLLAYAAVTPDVARFFGKLSADFQACFSLPVTQRVLAVDNSIANSAGGPSVTDVADACKPLVSSRDRTGTEFLQNGYNAGQAYHGMLHDGALTKTVRIVGVDVPLYSDSAAAPMINRPTLVAQVRYADRYDRLGSFTVVAQRIGGSSPESGDWWNTGNQQPIDVNVKPLLRQFNSLAGYTTATPSVKQHYRSGIGFFVAANGPGTRLADGTPISAVRVSGGGIPGLVYIPPIQAGQSWMDISNQNGDVVAAATRRCGGTVSASGTVYTNCPYLWFNRSTTVVPSGAAPVLRLPTSTEGSCATAPAVTQTCAWGGTWAPADLSAQLLPKTPITIEVFYGGQTTPTHVYTKHLVFPVEDITKAHLLGWPALTADSLVAARPQAGQTSLGLAWTGQVLNSLEVASATVTLANANGSVATPDEQVLRGSSMVVVSPGAEIQYAPVGTGTTQRGLLLNLRSWNGSSRSVWNSYDTAN